MLQIRLQMQQIQRRPPPPGQALAPANSLLMQANSQAQVARPRNVHDVLRHIWDQKENSKTVIPAKAGIHSSAVSGADQWVPAFAGTTIW